MKMFVAMSHSLSASQMEDAKLSLGVTEFVILNPELQAKFSKISPTASLVEIQGLAKMLVDTANESKCAIFFCTGEPTLTLWANIYASDFQQAIGEAIGEQIVEAGIERPLHNSICKYPFGLYCVQSTTERMSVEKVNEDGSTTKTQVFRHVQWRPMFDYSRIYNPVNGQNWSTIYS